jgi:hypothetical protein
LRTLPAVLPATKRGAISLPRVVDGVGGRTHAAPDHETVTGSELHLALARLDLAGILHAVPGQQHVATAARGLVGSWVVMRAPCSTITLPNASLSALLLASGLYRPLSRNCASLIRAAAATRLRTLTWLLLPNTTPLRLATNTVPLAFSWPRIWLGRAWDR